MSVRAKFRVWAVKHSIVDEQVSAVEVHLGAVTGPDGSENRAFWNATPSARLEMTITNPDAFESFKSGQEFYVDFTPA